MRRVEQKFEDIPILMHVIDLASKFVQGISSWKTYLMEISTLILEDIEYLQYWNETREVECTLI